MDNYNLVAGLDIGAAKTVILVGEMNDHGELNIIGAGEHSTQGLRKGSIVDIEGVTNTIRQALAQAERMCDCHLRNVYLAVTGTHLSSMNNKGVIAITNRNREISSDDVTRVLQASKVVALPQDRKIIHIHPRQYTVDGHEGIVDPVGMAGARLEVEINIVSASGTALQNLLRCVNKAGLQEEELLPAGLASAEAVLLPEEKDLGCLLVDIGGSVTDCAIFDQGRLWASSVIPVGGNLITNDIAIGLRIPVELAEEIKIDHGCVSHSLVIAQETIALPDIIVQETKKVAPKTLTGIIEPRMREILSLIKDEVKRVGYRGVFPGGMIITGGAAQLTGLAELAAEEMDLPVRIGYPKEIKGVSEAVHSPAYATAAGLVLYGAGNLSYLQAAPAGERFFGGVVNRVKHLFGDFFA
ncbi:cell division protein FtsA [Dehalobacterium formicoaceticum]|uniref:Cell division protein FtsA n=1 Tax=Dehalobacterium formicoaceticum TaxID=51515 RepID=A0ABT1Y0T5_9FIRM|nr:cell division protein FtsA [Dehalobacterium formicoaceticum]MCR6544484.1 cell division protein FtsA [Dehalobacterium formicoaceticum]